MHGLPSLVPCPPIRKSAAGKPRIIAVSARGRRGTPVAPEFPLMSPGAPALVSSLRRPLPSAREAWLYLRNNGVARSGGKFLATYVAGRSAGT